MGGALRYAVKEGGGMQAIHQRVVAGSVHRQQHAVPSCVNLPKVMRGLLSAGVGVGREMAENVSHGRLETKKSSSGRLRRPTRARP